MGRRELAVSMAIGVLSASAMLLLPSALAAQSDGDYMRETTEVIKVWPTISMERGDPNVTADPQEASNLWVAKYRREKALLGRSP